MTEETCHGNFILLQIQCKYVLTEVDLRFLHKFSGKNAEWQFSDKDKQVRLLRFWYYFYSFVSSDNENTCKIAEKNPVCIGPPLSFDKILLFLKKDLVSVKLCVNFYTVSFIVNLGLVWPLLPSPLVTDMFTKIKVLSVKNEGAGFNFLLW